MKLAVITGKYVGMSFEEIGCLDLAYAVVNELGFFMPDKVDGISWTVGNYKDLVEKDIEKSWKVMEDAFLKIGEKAPVKYLSIGDLLIVKGEEDSLYPAVYVGKRCAIASFIETGVQLFELDEANKVHLARRLKRHG